MQRMQTERARTATTDGAERARAGRARGMPPGLTPLLAGAATTVGGCGAFLALTGSGSPLRGPLTLFFLLTAPAAGFAAGLTGLDPFGRVLTSLAGAVVLDMLVAQGMLTVHHWSVRGGIVTVTVISLLALLLVSVRRSHGRTARRQGS